MDKYGYLASPNPTGGGTSGKGKFIWIGAGLLGGGLLVYLITRKPAPELTVTKPKKNIVNYTVTAPVDGLIYDGAGMPYAITRYTEVPDCHIEVDNMGIARLVTNETGITRGMIIVGGRRWFVTELDMNEALCYTRLENADILYRIIPYSMIGPGYLGYVTSGAHIGEEVFITINGQIGRVLYQSDSGQMDFVPLEVIDQTVDLWSTYIRPGGK